MIFKCDVSGQSHFVREDVVVADNAVVRDVNADHEKVARTDARRFSLAVRAMERAKLPNYIVVADFEIAPLALKLQILRLAAENSMLENTIPGPDFCESFDYSIGSDLTIWANFNVVLYDRCGMNGHFDRIYKIFQDLQDNRVLWILQILFMMLGCLVVLMQEETRAIV